jgi:hypothetical protein
MKLWGDGSCSKIADQINTAGVHVGETKKLSVASLWCLPDEMPGLELQ